MWTRAIAAEVVSCEFRLDQAPPAEDLFVYFNDDPAGVPEDAANGYTFDMDANTVSFHGSACMRITDGDVSDIDIVFGCPGPVLE